MDPITTKIFYVGKGTKDRMYIHEKRCEDGIVSNNNLSLFNKLNEIRDIGKKPIYKIVFESDDEVRCYEKERELIETIGLEKLTNLICGSYFDNSL